MPSPPHTTPTRLRLPTVTYSAIVAAGRRWWPLGCRLHVRLESITASLDGVVLRATTLPVALKRLRPSRILSDLCRAAVQTEGDDLRQQLRRSWVQVKRR